MCTDVWPAEVPTLTSLALLGTVRHLRHLVQALRKNGMEASSNVTKLRECLEWVPPGCRAALLHSLAPTLEATARHCTSETMLDFLDDVALALLSPASSLHVDRYTFPSRHPERYLAALASARGLTVLASRRAAPWKGEPGPVHALTNALNNMTRLRCLQLRHLHLHPEEEMVTFLTSLAHSCPLLTHLDLKHGSITDPCVAPILTMPRLTHLNLNLTLITMEAVETLLCQATTLLRLEAIVYNHYHYHPSLPRNEDIIGLCLPYIEPPCKSSVTSGFYARYNTPSSPTPDTSGLHNYFNEDNDHHSTPNLQLVCSLQCSMPPLLDWQGITINRLLVKAMFDPSSLPLPLPRTTYTIAPGKPNVADVCRACPLLQRVSVWHCKAAELKPLLRELSGLQHLRAINLSGLEWSLHGAGIAVNDEPMPLSVQVVEVTLTKTSCVDAYHLGALGICFPRVTHLRVVGAGVTTLERRRPLPWDGGRVFSDLLHLYYEGEMLIGRFGRYQMQQGLHSQLDVLLGYCEALRSLTLYTSTIDESLLIHALRNNRLRHLEELRIGQQRYLTCEVIRVLVKGAADLRVLGRVDWWREGMTRAEKRHLLVELRRRFRRLEVFGEEDEEEEEEEEEEERKDKGRPDLEEDPDPPRCLSPDEW